MKNHNFTFALAFIAGAFVLSLLHQNIWVYTVSFIVFAGLYIWQISFLKKENDVQGEQAMIPVALKFMAGLGFLLVALFVPVIRENILAYAFGFFIPNVVFIVYAIMHQKKVGGATDGRT